MTIGVNGFIGKRLTEARLARGILKQSHLADLLSMKSSSLIHSYENEINKPRPEMVMQMADCLKVKEDYFFLPFPKKTFPIFWRSSHSTTKQKREVAQAKFSWTKLIDAYLKEYLVMPKLNIPSRQDIGVPDEIETLSENDIENVALQLRQFWGLGTTPIHNVTTLLENNGILLSYGELDSDKLDAFSNKSEYDCSFHVFLGTDKGGALRSRMDASHELGHLVLHSHLSESEFLGQKHSLFEKQAFRFASAFLMPLPSFRDDVWMTSIEALKTLRKRWRVSVGAMMKRCEDLGLYGNKDTSRMWIKYRRNWETIENDNYEFETPQLLRRSLDLLISEGLRTKSQVLYDLPFHRFDIEKILNLPDGYLNEDFGNVVDIKIRDEHKQRSLIEGKGQLIEYKFR